MVTIFFNHQLHIASQRCDTRKKSKSTAFTGLLSETVAPFQHQNFPQSQTNTVTFLCKTYSFFPPHTPGTNKISHLERFLKKINVTPIASSFNPTPVIFKKKRTFDKKPQVTKVQKIQLRLQRSIEGVVHAQGPNFQTQVIPFWRHLKGGREAWSPKKRKTHHGPFLCSNSPLKEMNWRWCFFVEDKNREQKVPFWKNFCFEIS